MSRIARAAVSIVVLGGAFIPCIATAQRAGDMTIGVMAGVNYSKVSQDPESSDVSFEYKPGFVGGVFLGIQVNDWFSIEPEVLFSQKGSKVKGKGNNSALEGSVRINYIEIPVLAKFWFPVSNPGVKPFIFGGPEVEFKVSCTAEGAILAVTGSEDCDKTDNEINLKSTDFGVTGGAGVQFRAGGQDLRVDARYTFGLTDINDSSAASDNREIKNRAFAVTVGLGWPLSR
ncbi:MAG: porin family protein [Gemmatimonadaceae bacterium]